MRAHELIIGWRMSAIGPKRTYRSRSRMSAIGGKADIFGGKADIDATYRCRALSVAELIVTPCKRGDAHMAVGVVLSATFWVHIY